MPDEERDWVFTWGYGHVHPVTGESLARCFIRVHGTHESARDKMLAAFGSAWAFQYRSADDAGVEHFGLREIPYPAEPFETARKGQRR